MKEKRSRIINAILFVLLIISIGIILYLTKSDILKPKQKPVIIPNSGYNIIKIEDLQSKLDKLSFSNKKQDFYNKSSSINVNTAISSGKVNVTIKNSNDRKSYDVDKIDNAICIHTNVINGIHITYILTEDGKVYKIEDNLETVKQTENYKGKAKNLGLENITKIAVDKTLKFKLNNDLKEIVPSVYMISDDNRVFTDEKFVDNKKIVELVEKKTQETKENASNEN